MDFVVLEAAVADVTTIAELHQLGVRVACTVDIGIFDGTSADAADFPPEVLGNLVDERLVVLNATIFVVLMCYVCLVACLLFYGGAFAVCK